LPPLRAAAGTAPISARAAINGFVGRIAAARVRSRRSFVARDIRAASADCKALLARESGFYFFFLSTRTHAAPKFHIKGKNDFALKLCCRDFLRLAFDWHFR